MSKYISNYNPNLEEDILDFIKHQNDDLFMDKIYNPLRFLASYILQQYDNSMFLKNTQDTDCMVLDMVSQASIAMKSYRSNAGTTVISFLRVVMKNYFLSERTKAFVKKRNKNKTVYLEEVEHQYFEEQINPESRYETLKEEALSAWDKDKIDEVFDTKEQRKAVREVLKCLSNPEKYTYHWNSFVVSIGKKAKVSPQLVRTVMRKMQECEANCPA